MDNSPKTRTGKDYLNYLERSKKIVLDDEKEGSQTISLHDAKPKPEWKMAMSATQRHRSVENVKQYCINKMIGRLNTKQELALVSVAGEYRRQA